MPIAPFCEGILAKIGRWLCPHGTCVFSRIEEQNGSDRAKFCFFYTWNIQMLPATGTQLLRSTSTDLALSIAKRLGESINNCGSFMRCLVTDILPTARRFGKQIFLSVDVPVSIGDDSGGMIVEVEKALVDTLKEMEKK